MKKLESNTWWPTLLVNKDKYSLRELGEMFGVSAGAINTALKRNGISRASARPGPREKKPGWPKGKTGGATTGRGSRSVSEKRLLPWAHELGVKRDSDIAALCGLSAATVARIRRSRGIPAQGGRARRVVSDDIGEATVGGTDNKDQLAWRFTLDSGENFVVCADDIVHASCLAQGYATGVVAIELVGKLIS